MTTPTKIHLVSYLTDSGRGTRCGKDAADFVLITTDVLEEVTCKTCRALEMHLIRTVDSGFIYGRSRNR